MELYDTDKDGKISGVELEKSPGLKASLKILCTDQYKGITRDQIIERVNKWKYSGIGRTSLSCIVTRNGQPLVGASVKFVPEPFLSRHFKGSHPG